ncbi:relaxase [Pseudomonas luteola]|uniref:Relaxase n=1 Tax=Pseudomonas luteola TaxID=47886 RepID=A0A2X2C5B6_PSELU|nr:MULTISPECIES: MobH family relaxase [Pseudomonas]SPZ02518.1 relaxase [Pseudomonas luteola]
MLSLFRKKGEKVRESKATATSSVGYLKPEKATVLLSTPRRKKLLENIWQRTSLSKRQFEKLYLAPVSRYAELVQQLPASESHHHSYPGGMLDHGLEIVAYGLKMRQSMMLPPGGSPEAQAEQAEAWSAAVAYAALLHDIGKIAVDVVVELDNGENWHPWHGPLSTAYRVRYVKGRDYKLHNAAAGLLYMSVLGTDALDWLCKYPELWAGFIYVLAGQYEHAGILGELVTRADQASVAQELGGNPTRAISSPKQSIQRQLVEGLRYLLKEELRLNQAEASDGWLTDEGLWLVSKTVSDRLRAYLLAQGAEGIPDKNSAVFNILQDHSIVQPNPEGKAIWKATVTSPTGWKNTFTFLKLSAAMIWGAEERPPIFEGTVVVEGAASNDGSPINDGSVTPYLSSTFENQAVLATSKSATASLPNPDAHQAQAIQLPEKAGAKVDQQDDYVADLLSIMGVPLEGAQQNAVHEPEVPVETSPVTHIPVKESSVPVSDKQESATSVQIASTKKDHGIQFLDWVRTGVLLHKIVINDAKAKVHTVDGTAFLVTPEIFRRYVQEHPAVAAEARSQGFDDEWRWVQRCFEKLSAHRKRSNGLNIWTCEVCGPRKTKNLKGYLLNDPRRVFNEIPFDNPAVRLVTDN